MAELFGIVLVSHMMELTGLVLVTRREDLTIIVVCKYTLELGQCLTPAPAIRPLGQIQH